MFHLIFSIFQSVTYSYTSLNEMKDEYEVILGEDDILDDTGGQKERKSWTRMDKLLLMFCVLCDFSDGTEIDLPGLYNF